MGRKGVGSLLDTLGLPKRLPTPFLVTGLDRFGRVRDQRWLKTNAVIDTLDDFVYGYDPDGNRLYRDNLVNANFGELYHVNGAANGYDGLNQLVAFSRGALNATKDTIANAPHSQSWGLDAMGNWSSVTTTDQGVPSTQSRTHNAQNEIATVNGVAVTAYDNNGNLIKDENSQQYVYDAWNRLVQV